MTPVQLAAMVSTIANGGMYLPPRVLLESTDDIEGRCRGCIRRPFHPENQLPADAAGWCAPGDYGKMTSAKMRDDDAWALWIEGTGIAGGAERVQLGR